VSEIGFDGKVAIVTGAGGGLGRQHALLLASRGARVLVNDVGGSVNGEGSDRGPAEQVVAEIVQAGGEAVADNNTVATAEGGKAIVDHAVDAFGQIDIVVNNAGILRDKTFHNLTPQLLEPVLDVHLKGAFYVTQPAWVKMREQGYGRVISTTSQSGVLGNFGQANYGAAKMGLVGLTRVLALEGAKYNIKVNAIAPLARTRMTEDLMGEAVEKLRPELVSPVVAWLASQECSVSGEVFTVAAGRVARFFVGMTAGYFNPNLSVEDVRDHLAEIRDETGYSVPASAGEETAFLFEMMSRFNAD
jgi:NAD(P)-dependent dehydrogenase (short-subunit alcohol dehydrogenase family)